MSATLIALICALAACFWFMVENAGLNDQNAELRAECDDAEEIKRHLIDERLDEALETWSDGGDAS